MISDKIYIPEKWMALLSYNLGEPIPGATEYIRKEALLEWLESIVYQNNEHILAVAFNTAIEQVIDKLNSL